MNTELTIYDNALHIASCHSLTYEQARELFNESHNHRQIDKQQRFDHNKVIEYAIENGLTIDFPL